MALELRDLSSVFLARVAVDISAWPEGEADFYGKTLILFTLNEILLIYPSAKAHRSVSPPWGLALKL
ncbi:hypothetical protein [Pantoea sp. AS-PWVM4]|uniref:hypothetical protein n=1 Tax=Pantoea sp. AS-PWVM4 TaxID=1332069 RepID=UPI0012683EE1|nr:hypothetical protein [Pantoea sp. AS-PWVM4]